MHGDVFLTQPVSFTIIATVIAGIIGLFAVLLVSGSFARSERVSGYLVPSNGLVKIQASQFGTIEEFTVSEGDTVTQGQILAKIRVSNATSEGLSQATRNLQILEQQKTIVRNQLTLEENQLQAETSKLLAQKRELELRLQSLQRQIGLQRQITLSAKTAYEDVQDILQKGYVSKVESERRKQTWLAQQAQEALKEQELVEATALLEQTGIRLVQLPDETQQRLAQLQNQLSDLEARTVDQQGQQAYTVVAPKNGRVMSVNNASVGRTVEAAQPLLTIMPDGSTLVAELFVPSRAVGFVEEGQEVRLLYDAFPYQRFGSFEAKVDRVTETILPPGETQAPFALSEPVYRITARLEAQDIVARDRRIALQSGMTLQANIILERRSFLDWMLEPLKLQKGLS